MTDGPENQEIIVIGAPNLSQTCVEGRLYKQVHDHIHVAKCMCSKELDTCENTTEEAMTAPIHRLR